LEEEGAMGCSFQAVEFKEDSLGIPLTAMGFQATEDIAQMEQWERSRRMIGRLAETAGQKSPG
jgi:hypothetical protein